MVNNLGKMTFFFTHYHIVIKNLAKPSPKEPISYDFDLSTFSQILDYVALPFTFNYFYGVNKLPMYRKVVPIVDKCFQIPHWKYFPRILEKICADLLSMDLEPSKAKNTVDTFFFCTKNNR